jgi:hypothetical protein
MKKLNLVTISLILLASSLSVAKSSVKSPKVKSLRTTEANFSGSTVNGKYFHSPEAQVSIEKEKQLISVVKPRENMSIQLKKTQEDYK